MLMFWLNPPWGYLTYDSNRIRLRCNFPTPPYLISQKILASSILAVMLTTFQYLPPRGLKLYPGIHSQHQPYVFPTSLLNYDRIPFCCLSTFINNSREKSESFLTFRSVSLLWGDWGEGCCSKQKHVFILLISRTIYYSWYYHVQCCYEHDGLVWM